MINFFKEMLDKKYLLGGVSGIVESFFSHPFDFYKVKNQEAILKNKPINPLLIYLYKNIRYNGLSSVYVGLVPKLFNIFPSRLAFWGIQGTSIKYLDKYKIEDYNKYVYSGLITGTVQTLVESPFEVLKTRMIFNNKNTGFRIGKLMKLSLNGIEWAIMRNSIFCSSICLSNNIFKECNDIERFLYNSGTGFISSILTQPLDFMKTKYQSSVELERYSLFNEFKKHSKLIMRGSFPRAYVASINMGIGSFIFNNFEKYL